MSSVDPRSSCESRPGRGRPGVVGRHGDAWKVRVAAGTRGRQGERGRRRACSPTRSRCRARDVAIVSGHASRDKIVALAGIDPDETERRLAEASAAGKDAE